LTAFPRGEFNGRQIVPLCSRVFPVDVCRLSISDRERDPRGDNQKIQSNADGKNGFDSPGSHRRRTAAHYPHLIGERCDSHREEEGL
jgi:hypothetical protein